MGARFRCLKCHSTIDVGFDTSGNSLTRVFSDQKSLTKKDTDNYLWGGTYHLCPLLQYNKEQDFNQLVILGRIEKLL